ncbi:hypothetical protein HSR121_2934 [Halapricum desulfuricans]|uniref:Uncharacterized protein n=1 Tax=Halapricum desulfuricans TaxID=2841257 RepID=A0A897N433_9EURY|nr:hypothetical protein HSR121_2934 [Halapricum desulfuricans]
MATSIDKKHCVADIVFLSEAVKSCRPQKYLISACANKSVALVNAAGSVPRRLNTSTSSRSFDSVSIAA